MGIITGRGKMQLMLPLLIQSHKLGNLFNSKCKALKVPPLAMADSKRLLAIAS